MKHASIACLAFVLVVASCAMQGRTPTEETFLDKDLSSLELVDVAVAIPTIDGPSGGLLAAPFRNACRKLLINGKDYAVMSDAATDRLLTGGVTDGPVAAKAVGADALLVIHVTNWDTSELLSRGFIFASGSVTAWAARDGRRIYEHAFENVRMSTPGPVTGAMISETEVALSADLAGRVLASFPRKQPR